MTLATTAVMAAAADKLSRIYQELRLTAGVSSGSAAAGSLREKGDELLAVFTDTSDDFYVQADFNVKAKAVADYCNAESLMTRNFADVLSAFDSHCRNRGSSLDADITTLATFLSYYAESDPYGSWMFDPYFSDLWYAAYASRLPAAGVYPKAIHPFLSGTHMGLRAVGGSLTAGAAYDSNYAAVVPFVEVTADFSGGSAPPTVTVAGTDDTAATSTTWTATLSGNNPAGLDASRTITDEVTAPMARATVTLSDAAGVVAGSVLQVSPGAADEEYVVVEEVAGSDVTAAFRKAHDPGAAFTFYRAAALTPSVAGRRLRSVSGITIGVTGHSAGTVRVCGRQDRVAM